MKRERMILKPNMLVNEIINNRQKYKDDIIICKYITISVEPSASGQDRGKPISIKCPGCKSLLGCREWNSNKCGCGFELTVNNLYSVNKNFWCNLDIKVLDNNRIQEKVYNCTNTKDLGNILVNKLSEGKYNDANDFAICWIKSKCRDNILHSLRWNTHTFQVIFKCFWKNKYLQKQLDVIPNVITEHESKILGL